MTRLRNIIQQISEQDYEGIVLHLQATKADKFLTLLSMVREQHAAYDEIQKELNVNTSAFYTLKSRLYDKIQEFLLAHMASPKTELLRKIAAIPSLIYATTREKAIAILSKLETDLKEYDMPGELTEVYAAFKKIYLYSEKYYDYAQLYNKHVAYTVALDKAEDLLGEFIRKLSEYFLSRDARLLDVFPLIKEQMDNLCALYESHHLFLYKSIVNASMELFLPLEAYTGKDDPLEDMLEQCDIIIGKYPKHKYQYLGKVISYLNFEYYHKLGRHRKALEYFESINEALPGFLLYNFCCFSSGFLLSKIPRLVNEKRQDELYKDSMAIKKWFNNDTSDLATYINVQKYVAVSAFYVGRYEIAITELNALLNTVSLKNYPHTSVEIKMLLALCYSMVNKYDLAWNILRSASRKVTELNKERDYENAGFFIKFLKLQMSTGQKNKEMKLRRLWENFQLLNKNESHMLEYIVLDEQFIRILSKTIK